MPVNDVFGTPQRRYKILYLVPAVVTIIGTASGSPTGSIAQDLYGDSRAPIERRDENGRRSDHGSYVMVDLDRVLPQWRDYFQNGEPRSHLPPGVAVAGGQVVNLHLIQYADEAELMRDLYQKGANVIQTVAREKLDKGAAIEGVARWVVRARNDLKTSIRLKGPPLFKKIAELRNQVKYKSPAGPTYEGLRTLKTDEQIIQKVTETSAAFNKSGRILRSVGLTLEVASFVVAATQDSPDSLPPLPRSEDDLVEIEIVRLRLGIPFDANIDTHGHLKKNSYLQIDPTDFGHAGDEMDQENDEILWFFGMPISYTYQGVKWTVPGKHW